MPNKSHQKQNKKVKLVVKKTKKIRGHGNYEAAAKRISDDAIGAIKKVGCFLRPHAANALKTFGGGMLKSLVSKISGHGDYKMHGMPLSSYGLEPPVFAGKEDTIISHREYVQDITSSTSFTNNSYDINPANSSLFPWLASIAACYEEWELEGLLIEYKSTSAVALNSTNTALGTVIIGCNYDIEAPAFTTKFQMENYDGSMSYEPCDSFLYPVECKRSKSVLTKFFTDQTTNDKRLSYLGKLQIATTGMQAVCNIGELWVTYKVRLIKPRPAQASTAGDYFHMSSVSNVSSNAPLGVSPEITAHGRFVGTTVTYDSFKSIITVPRKLPPGEYWILYYGNNYLSCANMGSIDVLSTVTLNSNAVLKSAGTYSNSVIYQSNTDKFGFGFRAVNIVDNSNNNTNTTQFAIGATVSASLGSTANTSVDLFIIPMANNITSGYFAGVNQNPLQIIKNCVRQALFEIKEEDAPIIVDPVQPESRTPVTVLSADQVDVSLKNVTDPGTLTRLLSMLSKDSM